MLALLRGGEHVEHLEVGCYARTRCDAALFQNSAERFRRDSSRAASACRQHQSALHEYFGTPRWRGMPTQAMKPTALHFLILIVAGWLEPIGTPDTILRR